MDFSLIQDLSIFKFFFGRTLKKGKKIEPVDQTSPPAQRDPLTEDRAQKHKKKGFHEEETPSSYQV